MKRSDTIRVDASQVQGEGAFVEWKRLTYGERRELTQKANEKKLNTVEFLVSRIADWNWIGSDGAPLELPKTVDDLNYLYDEEITFLADIGAKALQGRLELTQEAEKN